MRVIRTVGGEEFPLSPLFLQAAEKDPEAEQKYCKVCGQPGHRVLKVTVATHVAAEYWHLLTEGFRFSPTPDCPIMYYNNQADVYFSKSDVKTRFGPKENNPPKPLCYCLNVLEEQIENEILEKQCCDSLEDIEAYTKAGTGKWCLTTNPSGRCCREYLQPIIHRYLTLRKAKPTVPKVEALKQRLQEATQPSRRIQLRIGGMSCSGCEATVKAVLEKAGALDVKVSFPEGAATLATPPTIQPDELVKAVEDSGYSASILQVKRLRNNTRKE
ncbi:MAG: cation transporter [Candidatus Bathyarchaeia archaeon]